MLPPGCWLRCLVKIAHHSAKTGAGYTWHEMTIFSRWEPDHCVVLCIDTPDGFRSQLEQSLAGEQGTIDMTDPFALFVPLMDQITILYDQSVWSIRDLIRRVEKVSQPPPIPLTKNYGPTDYLDYREESSVEPTTLISPACTRYRAMQRTLQRLYL